MDKKLVASHTAMLVLSLLDERDMYGYEMIEALARRSDDTFAFKAGTLYPLLHTMEQKGVLCAYEQSADGRVRKYYRIMPEGKGLLQRKKQEWERYSGAVNRVLGGRCAHVLA